MNPGNFISSEPQSRDLIKKIKDHRVTFPVDKYIVIDRLIADLELLDVCY
jgi:hypothetical protein